MKLAKTSLPSKWKFSTIRESYCFTRKPRGLDLLKNGSSIPFFPMNVIPMGKIYTNEYIEKDAKNIGSGTYIENGDLIVAKITPSFENGKQAIVNLKTDFAYATTEVIPIQEIQNVSDKFYLFFALLHPEIRSDLACKMEGSTGRQRLSKEVLGDRIIPLPPLSEQKKIAHVLSTVQRGIEQQERLIQVTTELKKTLMQKFFTEGLHGEPQKETEIGLVPESWAENQIGQICEMRSGGTPSRKVPEYWNGNIPWIKTGEIDYCSITETEEFITQEGLENSSAKIFPKGTLLVAMYGQGITRGKVAIMGIQATTNQACAAITPKNEDELLTSFLFYFLQFHYEVLRNRGHGANQRNLSMTLIKIFPVFYPSAKDQKAIVEILEKHDHKIELVNQKRVVYEDLFRTLLHKLMTAQIRVDEIEFDGLSLSE